MTLWTLALLLPAALVTAFRGRTGWLWIGTALALAAAGGLWAAALALGAPLAGWLPGARTAALHDTYYVVVPTTAFLTTAALVLLPGLILLLLPGHPRRDRRDTGLFWAAALLLSIGEVLGPVLLQMSGPLILADDPVAYVRWVQIGGIASLAGWLIVLWAGLRPLWLGIRRRAAG